MSLIPCSESLAKMMPIEVRLNRFSVLFFVITVLPGEDVSDVIDVFLPRYPAPFNEDDDSHDSHYEEHREKGKTEPRTGLCVCVCHTSSQETQHQTI